MAAMSAALSAGDLRTLVKGESEDERAVIAHKLCRRIEETGLDAEERAHAEQILRMISADAAELVRRAVSVTLKCSPLLPRDVALQLARDVESVAVPVLTFSPAFSDEDLINIVKACGPVRQIAIAKRPRVSSEVTAAIVEHGVEPAVRAACANDNAEFAEGALQKAITRFANSAELLSAVSYRKVLPVAVTERLVSMVSDQVRDHLINHHALSPEMALQIALGARERATIDLVDQAGRTSDVEHFVAHLNKNGRLTPSLMLRALSHGHMTFFEWAIAELAQVPHHRTALMVHDAGPLGLRAIYERAGMPNRLFPAFRAGVDTFHSLQFDGRAGDQERFQERMLERFLTQASGVPKDDVDYLLDKMDRVTADLRRSDRQAPVAAVR